MTSAPRAIPPSVNGWHAEYLDAEYARYKADPTSVPPDLRAMFQGFDLALGGGTPTGKAGGAGGAEQSLLQAYRHSGHLAATLDPLGRPRPAAAHLDPAAHGIADLNRPSSIPVPGKANPTIGDLVAFLKGAYCGNVGWEFEHLPSPEERAWFASRAEAQGGLPKPSAEDQTEALRELLQAETLERFIGKRYQGKKRFSCEGGEALLPLLGAMARRAGELGVGEIIMGMAHRGRLAVLTNLFRKDPRELFTEFEDNWEPEIVPGGGDVKYHRGFSCDVALRKGGTIHLSMLNNPSHLEAVNPVVLGRCRAQQEKWGDRERKRIAPLLIHGDAAVAGQGIVAECLTMSGLAGYNVGGSLHIVVNNQLGFTTDPTDGRSTTYCTDIAKMINAPVIHVNGDDVDAVVAAAVMAVEYRQTFGKDIFVDLVCYRRFGHNEQDEPTYTQPTMYALVKKHPGSPTLYRQKLVSAGVVTDAEAQSIADRLFESLDKAQTEAQQKPMDPIPAPGRSGWEGFVGGYTFQSPKTGVSREVLAEVASALGRVPDGFNVNGKLKQVLASRAAVPTHGKVSHADAEQLAIGTLLLEGYPVRLSGQDVRRGTFSHRHGVLRDEQTGQMYTPLNAIRPDQKARFEAWDSPLSELAVMGFDYGYSRGMPKALVMWEAQFGDFVNGAQIMIDQFLSSSEVKWNRWGGLVLLLPHGQEGQGPEHSSARPERFLQMCANDCMEVVFPTTGAQVFHMLRRQVLRNFRKPLVVMTPKKTLRKETSTIDELLNGEFRHLIDDPKPLGASKDVRRVIYCTGKIYHELDERRELIGRKDVAIVRVEQIYPFHSDLARSIDGKYPKAAERVWVQEEPRNFGAFLHLADVFRADLGVELSFIGRPACASPATGSEHTYKRYQEEILTRAIGAGKPSETHAAGQDASNGSPVKPAASRGAVKSK